MKVIEKFNSKPTALRFRANMGKLPTVSCSGVYVMNNRYACTVTGDFTQEQVAAAKL